jgi:cell division protein FtsN
MKGSDFEMRPGGGRTGAAAGEKRHGINPLFAGIVIGMVLGVAMALALALYLNREKNVFVERTQPVEPLPAPPKPAAVPPIAANTGQVGRQDGERSGEKTGDQPRFDFYQILPGEPKPGAKPEAKQGTQAITPHAAAPAAARPATSGPARGVDVKPSTDEYFLQAGAFQNQSEAENMRAKVAFAGFQASVKSVNLPERGTLFRVRLGPYKSLDEVNRVKGVLGQSGIAAAVVNNKD